ncbi:MAG: hypothetical protein ACOCYB_07500 [Alkalispirochaeta sp.]
MTVAEQYRREQEEYGRLLPEIVEGIRVNEQRVELSRRLSEQAAEVDQKRLYRWIQLTEEHLESYRRRSAAALAAGMWMGVLAVVVPSVGMILGRVSWAAPAVRGSVIVGAVVAVAAALRLRGVTQRAYRRWLERELA